METQEPANRRMWLIIVGALVASVFTYVLLCLLVTQSRAALPIRLSPATTVSLVLQVLAVVALLASIVWTHVTTSGKIGDVSVYGERQANLMEPDLFRVQSLVALALAESCTISGLTLFFMRATIKSFIPFALGTLLVDLFFILPRGLKY